MGAVISALVYTLIDQGGNPRKEGWFLWEFREDYSGGGITIDVGNYFRHVEQMLVNPASGAIDYLPKANDASLPGVVQSGSPRIELWTVVSGVINTSGQNITVLSGQTQIASGYTDIWSGRLTQQSYAPARGFDELASGIAVSGVRARVFALGH